MSKKKRAIVALKCDGSMAGWFECAGDVRKVGCVPSSVLHSLRTGKLYRCIKWMYDDDYKKYFNSGRTSELAYTLKEGFKHGMKSWREEKPHHFTEESLERIRQQARITGRLGKGKPKPWMRVAIAVRNKNTGEELYFECMNDAAKYFDTNHQNISAMCGSRRIFRKEWRGRKISRDQYDKLVKLQNKRKPRKK